MFALLLFLWDSVIFYTNFFILLVSLCKAQNYLQSQMDFR